MKFKTNRTEFYKALTRAESIVSSREIRSVISNILVETDDNKIILTTTDLELGIKTSISAEISAPGKITLPAKKLSQAIREFQCSGVLIESDANHQVNILDADGISKARITLMGASSEEYPKITTLPEKKFISFPTSLVSEMIRKTASSVAEEDARYVFNGLYVISNGNSVSFVGTDGRRLSRVKRDFPNALAFSKGIILPNKAVRELQKLLDTCEEGKIAYDESDSRVVIRLANVDLISKLIEGQYPDYEQVIPKKLGNRINLSRDSFENSLRRVTVMAAEPTRQIRLIFMEKMLQIAASTPDIGEAQDSIDINYEGEETTIAFNSNYIMDIIKVLTSEKLDICFTSPSAPAVILDPSDNDFIAVIMPMKI